MNKKTILLSAALSTVLFSSYSFSSVPLTVEVSCPANNTLANYQDKVIGNGVETIYTSPQQVSSILFNSSTNSQIEDFSTYQSQSVKYASNTGKITCHFTSMYAANPGIDMVYTLMNGEGGIVTYSSNSTITIQLPVGSTH